MGNKEEKTEKKEVKNKEEKENSSSKNETKEVSTEDKLQQAEEKFLRIFSEYENFRKRTQKEKADLISGAAADVYKVILPILDDLDRAKDNIERAEDVASLKEGLELIFDKLTKSLKSNGLELMDVKEQDFNADEHEAITNIPAPSEELKGKVLEVVEKGYTLNGKIIRFPKVVVGA
ncbi:MAG: nucleotide exchange factor GrpE [Flavobacteriales bacterium]|nr:nucleotide exchange factor GrpE [Flavobacteriales bacterium]|tara:strand:- start:2324 stop:2854 length:531 start_codon:yes stop_codon:yes gene_type:complete